MSSTAVVQTHREKLGIWTVTITPETGQHAGKFHITAVYVLNGEHKPSRAINHDHLTQAEVDGWNPPAAWYTPIALSSRKQARMLRGDR